MLRWYGSDFRAARESSRTLGSYAPESIWLLHGEMQDTCPNMQDTVLSFVLSTQQTGSTLKQMWSPRLWV